MNADRIEWYANQLRGIPVADIPRKVRSILMDATNEARRAEREKCAERAEVYAYMSQNFIALAEEIRAME